MSVEHVEKSLSVEHDETEEEQRTEREREVVEHPDPQLEHLRAELTRVQTTLAQLSGSIDASIAAKSLHVALTSDPPKPSGVEISDPTPSPELEAKEKALADAQKKAGESKEKDSEWTVGSYLTLFGAFAAAGAGVFSILKYLVGKANNKPTDDLKELDKGTRDTLDALLAEWQNLDDAVFWTKLADHVDSHPTQLSLGDQLVFMNLTVMLGGNNAGFLWDSAKDESDMAEALVAAYHSGGDKASAMYRAAATLRYQDDPVPRVVTAQLLQLALAWVGAKASGSVTA